ncbi:MAG TPA: PadR family transcriptional regulator [Acidimicrobiales bacterium]|nr:PadR family transcriptional regulator [Acidimicrobiales bacterium]
MAGASTPRLTTSSYAILGLLALRPWTTYELATQMAVSLRNFWPRAESKLYEEPKKLLAHGLAEVRQDHVGRRPRSVYEITPAGREALRGWLDEPGAMAVLEFESLVKVFFAEQGTRSQLMVTLERIAAEQRRRVAIDAAWARRYLEGRSAFPERLAVLSLVGRLQADINHAVLRWAEWAVAEVAGWPEDLRAAPPAPGAFETVARLGGDRRGPGVDDGGDGHEPVLAAGEDPEALAPG